MNEIRVSNTHTRRKWIILWIGIFFCIALIATGLEDLSFLPGKEFSFEFQTSQNTGGHPESPLDFADFSFITSIIAFVLATTVLAIIGRFLILLKWRSILIGLVIIIGGIALINIPNPDFENEPIDQISTNQADDPLVQEIIPPSPTPDDESVILILLIFSLLIFAYIIWRAINRKDNDQNDLEQLFSVWLDPAKKTGSNLSIVSSLYERLIVYFEENEIVEMPGYLTPNEFTRVLIEFGLPEKPVVTISTLFEKDRYSQMELSVEEVELFLESATEIYDHLKKNA